MGNPTLMAELPGKSKFYVAELVPFFARALACSEAAARQRIYRAIRAGRIAVEEYPTASPNPESVTYRIPRDEAIRVLSGTPRK